MYVSAKTRNILYASNSRNSRPPFCGGQLFAWRGVASGAICLAAG